MIKLQAYTSTPGKTTQTLKNSPIEYHTCYYAENIMFIPLGQQCPLVKVHLCHILELYENLAAFHINDILGVYQNMPFK